MIRKYIQYGLLTLAGMIWFTGCGDAIREAIKNSVFDSNTSYAITDNSSIDSAIVVSSDIISLDKITLLINLDHNRTGDLKIVLSDPNGVDVVLADHRGADNNTSGALMFSESESKQVTDPAFPSEGSYQPEENLSVLHYNNPNGTWHLKISDTIPNGKQGILNGWLMIISGTK